MVCELLRQTLQSLVSHPFLSLATFSWGLENSVSLPPVLLAFSFSRCWRAQRLIPVLIWNTSRGVHDAVRLLLSWWGGGGRRGRVGPLLSRHSSSQHCSFLFTSLSLNQQGSQQRDVALLIRRIRRIYERRTERRRALSLPCSPLKAGHLPCCWLPC